MSPLSRGAFEWSYGDFFLISLCIFWYSFSSGGDMTHQQRRHGTPAPKRTLTHASVLNLALSIMTLMLFTVLPLPAIKAPVYASCNVECSNMDNRMPAVHWSNE